MKLLRPIVLAAVMALAGGCALPIVPFALMPAGYALWYDMTSDWSFQNILDVAWDDDGSLYVIHANQDGIALFRWESAKGVTLIRPLPELGRSASAFARMDVSRGRLLIRTSRTTLTASEPRAPLRWLPIGDGMATWDNDQILVSAWSANACGAFQGIWKGDAAWSAHDALYVQDQPWGATLSPSRLRLAYSFRANPSDSESQIKVIAADGHSVSFADPTKDGNWVWLSESSLLVAPRLPGPFSGSMKALDLTSGQVQPYRTDHIADATFRVLAVRAAPSGSDVAWVVDRQDPAAKLYESNKRDIRIVLADPTGQRTRQILSLKDFPRGPRFPGPDPGVVVMPRATSAPSQEAR
jgi:hypothetical protein